jgi:DNA-binding CsgD family transcriptional regulator|nr:MAG TPA_asm: Sigma factor AlgU negative regulatory factor, TRANSCRIPTION.96A [Bacteriophage sp.]
MGNKIVENETLYTFLLNSMYFNIARGEKRIFELWRLGENNCNIAKELNISEGTVRNRKKTLQERAKLTLQNTL